MIDPESYRKFPQHTKWFNKLWVAEQMGYSCGPCGVPIPSTGTYIVRPIYNLVGMGVGARVEGLDKGDVSTQPGYFWCEYLTGKQYSADYKFVNCSKTGGWWEGISCWVGMNKVEDLSKFITWTRSDYIPPLPHQLDFKSLGDVEHINVEFKGDKVFEVHLRETPDPQYHTLIPLFKSDLELYGSSLDDKTIEVLEENGRYQYIESFDDADGHLLDPRLGFLVK